ncbi:Paf1 complex component [Batrachochytrium dendrobatidis]|nr:Paf1 complex component [Batrachochytrium dendrobatidis]
MSTVEDDLFGDESSDDGWGNQGGNSHSYEESEQLDNPQQGQFHSHGHLAKPARYSPDETGQSHLELDQDNNEDEDDNLFGDESDDNSQRMGNDGYNSEDGIKNTELERRNEEILSQPELVVETSLPTVGGPRPENENLFLIKPPNFLHIEPIPYDRATYAQLDNDLEKDEDGSRERARLHVENTIRWRYDAKHPDQKNSNARLVRWEDNSFSLLVGEEQFEVAVTSLQNQHHYLAVQHSEEGYIQNRARFNKLMSFRPFSAQSLTHKRVTMAIVGKHSKKNRTRLITTTEDPEKAKQLVEKAETERLKARRKLESKRASTSARERGGRVDYYNGSDDDPHYRSGNRNIIDKIRSNRYDYQEEDDDGFVVADDALDEDEDDFQRSSKLMAAKSSSYLKRSAAADFDESD